MNEELEQLLNGLSDEQKAKFIEKIKKDVEAVVKMAAAERAKEEAKKLFKTSGRWEYSDESNKLTAEISDKDKKSIKIKLDEKNVIELSKSEFFNLYALLSDVYSSVKEDKNFKKLDEFKDSFDLFDSLSNIYNDICCHEFECSPRKVRRNNKFFHII